jgi:hypothetical protein
MRARQRKRWRKTVRDTSRETYRITETHRYSQILTDTHRDTYTERQGKRDRDSYQQIIIISLALSQIGPSKQHPLNYSIN